jgi:hypothetical protein
VGKAWWQLIAILLTFVITLIGVAVVAGLVSRLRYRVCFWRIKPEWPIALH